jgi:hypothetical protein
MDPNSLSSDETLLEALRLHRAELRESMGALENALAAPAIAGQALWVQRVHVALLELSADFREHVAITEGTDGLYRDLLKTSPRLSDAVASLTREHALITGQIDDLLILVTTAKVTEDLHKVRDIATALLGRLVRHRERGSDLVFEAYEVDIGGET